MLVMSDKKGFAYKPLVWQEAIRSVENKGLHFYDTRPPKLGRKEDRVTLGIALSELGFSVEMAHWIIFWIMTSFYIGYRSRSFVELRREIALATSLDAVGFSRLATYLRIRRMA